MVLVLVIYQLFIYLIIRKPMKSSLNIPVVWAIIEKIIDWEKNILIQTRRKPWTEYHDTIETPVWRIEDRENVFDWLTREVKEECNLTITHINLQDSYHWENSIGFNSIYCTQQLANWMPWIMFCFVCKCEGELKHQETETRNPKWVKVTELWEFLKIHKVFDLEKPFFDYYLNHHEWIEYQEFNTLSLI